MSFIEHLTELRRVLIQSAIAVLGSSIVCWFLSGKILDILVERMPVERLYFTSPVEAFMIRMKVSFVVGTMIVFPFVLFKIWSFVAPGLFSFERRRVYPLVVSSTVLFYAGVIFCYTILIPVVLRFLVGFGTEYLDPLLSVSSYFGFVARLCFAFGVVFQVPIVVLLLASLGLVTPRFLLGQWRYGVLAIFVASAILTPPDALSMVVMALPVLFLYMASILVAFVAVRKRNAKEESDESK